jgi:hypothetical protein
MDINIHATLRENFEGFLFFKWLCTVQHYPYSFMRKLILVQSSKVTSHRVIISYICWYGRHFCIKMTKRKYWSVVVVLKHSLIRACFSAVCVWEEFNNRLSDMLLKHQRQNTNLLGVKIQELYHTKIPATKAWKLVLFVSSLSRTSMWGSEPVGEMSNITNCRTSTGTSRTEKVLVHGMSPRVLFSCTSAYF